FEGHDGPINSVVFAPDGRRLLTGSWDSSALVWDVSHWAEGDPGKLSAKELEAFWADLAGEDATRAYRALWALAVIPGKAVPLLKERLQPITPAEPRCV